MKLLDHPNIIKLYEVCYFLNSHISHEFELRTGLLEQDGMYNVHSAKN